MIERIKAAAQAAAAVLRGAAHTESVDLHGHFEAVCIGPDGTEKWRDTIENLVTTVGKNSLLDKFLDLAAAHTTIFMGLKGTGTAVVGDTMASHGSWNEVGGANQPTYSGTRKTPAFSAANSGSKAVSSAVSFGITGSGTVAGCFIVMSGTSAQDNTTGVLYSAGDFSGGSKTVGNGDTLNVTYTASA